MLMIIRFTGECYYYALLLKQLARLRQIIEVGSSVAVIVRSGFILTTVSMIGWTV
jgi:hypothetical protein